MMIEYIGYILAALTLIGNVVYNFYYKNKYEDRKTLIEKRFSVYKEYLSQTDIFNPNAIISQYINECRDEMIKWQGSTMLNSNIIINAANHARFALSLNNALLRWRDEWNKQLDNTHSIRLVCSNKVYMLLNEYIRISKEQIINQFEHLLDPVMLLEGLTPNTANKIFDNKKIVELLEIKAKLEMAMREDIGNI